MKSDPQKSAAARPVLSGPSSGWQWTLAGALAGALFGIAILGVPEQAGQMFEFPAVDNFLRLAGRWQTTLLVCAGGSIAAVLFMARRQRTITAAAAGFAGMLSLTLTFSVWNYSEVAESRSESQELQAVQTFASEALRNAITTRFIAASQLAAFTGIASHEQWDAAARELSVDLPGTKQVVALNNEGKVKNELMVPANQTMLDGLNIVNRQGERWAATTSSDLIALSVPTSSQGSVVLLCSPNEMLAELRASIDLRLELRIAVGKTGEHPEIKMNGSEPSVTLQHLPEPTKTVTAGLVWNLAVHPSASWIQDHHHPANTVTLLLGVLISLACVFAIRAANSGLLMQQMLKGAMAASQNAHARARIAAHARDAISQEAAHVIRARIRETMRALDTATDPQSDTQAHREGMRRIGASLVQAEGEVAALLEAPAHTRVARAERDAAIDHQYASAIIEFPGGPSIDLGQEISIGALTQIQQELNSTTFAIMTSDNPMSDRTAPEVNMLRRGVLALELRNAGTAHRPAIGRSPDGTWSENGFAVATTIGEADALAEFHHQAAYFWFDGTQFSIHEMVGKHRTIRLPRTSASA